MVVRRRRLPDDEALPAVVPNSGKKRAGEPLAVEQESKRRLHEDSRQSVTAEQPTSAAVSKKGNAKVISSVLMTHLIHICACM